MIMMMVLSLLKFTYYNCYQSCCNNSLTPNPEIDIRLVTARRKPHVSASYAL